MPEPLLHLGNIGLVIKRIGGGSRAQRVHTDLEAQRGRIGPHQLVDPVRGDGALQPLGAVVAQRAEQRAGIVPAMAGASR